MTSTHARLAALVVLWSGLTTALLFPGGAGGSVLDDAAARTANNQEGAPELTAADLAQLIVLYVASGTQTKTATPDPDPPLPPDPGPQTGDPSNSNDPNDPNDPGDPGDPGDPNDPGNPTSGEQPPTHHNPEPATLISGVIGGGLLLLARYRRRQRPVPE